jgi:hypothetical protein
MTFIQQPIELAIRQPEDDVDSNTERGRDPALCPSRNALEVAPLDQRHDTGRNASTSRDVDLPPAAPDSQGAKRSSDSHVVHGPPV